MAVSLNLTEFSNLPALKLMALDYPALQIIDFKLPSFQVYEHGPGFLDKTTMVNYWLTYAFGHRDYFNTLYNNHHHTDEIRTSECVDFVSIDLLPKDLTMSTPVTTPRKDSAMSYEAIADELTKAITNPMFAPLMATDDSLAKLPQSYIMNAEFDVLRDEGYILAERLRQNGVPVEHKFWGTEEHGFLNFVEIDDSAMKETDDFAKYFLNVVNSV